MAFKNKEALKLMMQKKQEVPEPVDVPVNKKSKPARLAIKKAGDAVMATDTNGVAFLQNPVLKVTKSTSLNIRITEEVKMNIDYLAKKYNMSQSDLVTALVADAMHRDADS